MPCAALLLVMGDDGCGGKSGISSGTGGNTGIIIIEGTGGGPGGGVGGHAGNDTDAGPAHKMDANMPLHPGDAGPQPPDRGDAGPPPPHDDGGRPPPRMNDAAPAPPPHADGGP